MEIYPSFNQKFDQLLQVTVFPVQEWAISWIATDTPDLSPTMIEGLANVNKGFSIPPIGNEGGKMTIL